MQTLFFALCAVALVAFVRLLWGAWQAKRWGRKLLLAGLAATLFLIVLVTLPSFLPAWVRVSSSRNACMANLAAIQGAKETWAREHMKDSTDVPQPSDLIGPGKYLRARPDSPSGGTYRLGAVRDPPTCSISDPGHTLDLNR